MSNSSISHTDRTLSSATTPGSEPGRNSNKEVFYIPQSSRAGALPSDGLMSYPEHLLGKYYSSAEMQSVYSTAPANWAVNYLIAILETI